MNLRDRIGLVFTAPAKSVDDYETKATWQDIMIPVTILILLSWLFIFIAAMSIDFRGVIDQAIEKQIQSGAIADSTARQVLSGKNLDMAAETNRNRFMLQGMVINIIAPILWLFGQALALWLAVLIFIKQSNLRYKTTLAVVSLSSVILWVAVVLRLILSIITKKAFPNLSPIYLIKDSDPSSIANIILSRIDPFQIWAIIYMGIGIGVILKNREKQGATVALSIWLVWNAILVLLAIYRRDYFQYGWLPV
jgi:hypothetical protein